MTTENASPMTVRTFAVNKVRPEELERLAEKVSPGVEVVTNCDLDQWLNFTHSLQLLVDLAYHKAGEIGTRVTCGDKTWDLSFPLPTKVPEDMPFQVFDHPSVGVVVTYRPKHPVQLAPIPYIRET
jgi:hypothetical protein